MDLETLQERLKCLNKNISFDFNILNNIPRETKENTQVIKSISMYM